MAEGGLAKRLASLVQGQTLAEIANEHDLWNDIIVAGVEKQGPAQLNENILADCIEALLGALYLDQGFEICKDVIEKLYGYRIETYKNAPQDPKTELQEWVQAKGLPLPEYEITQRTGPDHAPSFIIQVTVQGFKPVKAEGSSRRQAEKSAARLMLEKLGISE